MKCRKTWFTTEADIKREIDKLVAEREDAIYAGVLKDITPQILAVVCLTLNKDYGFGKKRIKSFISGLHAYTKLMDNGIMGKTFNTIDCIDYVRKSCGVDRDKEFGKGSD